MLCVVDKVCVDNVFCVAPYVKVYLMDNGKCVLKRRTRLARKTLDPLYQQQLQFEENPEGKVLQVIHTVLYSNRLLSAPPAGTMLPVPPLNVLSVYGAGSI